MLETSGAAGHIKRTELWTVSRSINQPRGRGVTYTELVAAVVQHSTTHTRTPTHSEAFVISEGTKLQ